VFAENLVSAFPAMFKDVALTQIYCPNLKYILGKGVGEGAFQNCKNLSELNLPNLKSTGVQAFENCSSLHQINLPQLTEIKKSSF
jgi:hypothetical protein